MKLCPACDRHLFGPEPACPFCGAEQATTAARPAGGVVASLTLALALGTAACGPVVEPPQSDGSSTAADEDTGPPPPPISTSTTTTATVTATTGVEPTTDDGPAMTTIEVGSTTGEDSDDSPCAFYAGCPPDVGSGAIECDVYLQDCAPGEKCLPWADDGGTEWNATRCAPYPEDPDAPGEPCMVEGSGTSGIDSCDVGAMCFHVDPRTNEGTCVSLCTGSSADPQCAAPEELCVTLSEVVPLCQDSCHPLSPECTEGLGCYPGPAAEEFVCWWPTDAPGVYGEDCDFTNACAPGHTCADALAFPSCAGVGCCTEYCDLTAGVPCPEADQGVACVPFYAEGTAPPGFENVGTCILPP